MSNAIEPNYVKYPSCEHESKEHDKDDFGCEKHRTRDYDTGCWRKPESREFESKEFRGCDFDKR
jgi:hypothetical protein